MSGYILNDYYNNDLLMKSLIKNYNANYFIFMNKFLIKRDNYWKVKMLIINNLNRNQEYNNKYNYDLSMNIKDRNNKNNLNKNNSNNNDLLYNNKDLQSKKVRLANSSKSLINLTENSNTNKLKQNQKLFQNFLVNSNKSNKYLDNKMNSNKKKNQIKLSRSNDFKSPEIIKRRHENKLIEHVKTYNYKNRLMFVKKMNNYIGLKQKEINSEKIIIDDKKILEIQNNFLKELWNIKMNDRLLIFNKLKVVKTFKCEHNYSLDVSLLDKFVVRKLLKHSSLGFLMFKSEVQALLKLNNYDHFPNLLTFDPKRYIIYMSYCGEPINHENCPFDWLFQFEEISKIMKYVNITSSDIIERNICVLNHKIYIIDFGLSNQFSESVDVSLSKLYKILLKFGRNKKYIRDD